MLCHHGEAPDTPHRKTQHMTIETPPDTHTLWHTHDETAVMVFHGGPGTHPEMPSRIHRHYRTPGHGSAMDDGRMIGRGPSSCALIVKVAPHDLIEVVEPVAGRTIRRYYRAGPDLRIEPLDLNWISRAQIAAMLQSSPPDDHGTLPIRDGDLENLFSRKQPAWLQMILDAQLEHWRVHHVGHYYHYMTRQPSRHDIYRCVRGAPFWALARFKDRLSPIQRSICARKSPSGAICFAIESFPPVTRRRHYLRYPDDVIRHASQQLPDDDLILCVNQAPMTAIEHCLAMTPGQRALVLATVNIKTPRCGLIPPPPRLKRWVVESLSDCPAVWLAVHQGCFANVARRLGDRLGVSLGPTELLEIHGRMEPSCRESLIRYIASLI